MENHVSRLVSGRRAFLRAVLPGSALFCLGGPCLLAAQQTGQKSKEAGQKHKFLKDAGMSFADVFKFSYANHLPLFRGLEREIGSEKFTAVLKRIIDDLAGKQAAERAKKLARNDLAAFAQELKNPDSFFQNLLTFEIIEDTPQALETRITECLWAKTFREANAGDLGYVLTCYGDYAAAQAFNPKMRMIRTKTLMQGDDFCNHRYIIEG